MRVESAGGAHLGAWSAMRATLWPSATTAEHGDELAARLAAASRDLAGFVVIADGREIVGFAEAALRRDYVNGCDTSPVGFLEGIYVEPLFRRRGVAGLLIAATEAWARAAGCTELASDASLDNVDSHAFHLADGFEETERVVFFRKSLAKNGPS